jgi:hypothetical protein
VVLEYILSIQYSTVQYSSLHPKSSHYSQSVSHYSQYKYTLCCHCHCHFPFTMSRNRSATRRPQSDEEIANALQEQYRQEFVQRQARRNARSSASAPPEPKVTYNNSNSNNNGTVYDEVDWSAHPPPPARAPPRRSGSTVPLIVPPPAVAAVAAEEDERMARELEDEELAKRLSRMHELESTQSSFLDERGIDMDIDMEQARRIAQEMNDAEMAQRLSAYEQEALQRSEREQQQQQQQRAAPNSAKSVVSRILPLICCGVAISIPLLFLLGVFNGDDASDFFGDLGDAWIDTDPWKGDTTGTDPQASPSTGGAFRWSNNNNNNNGLTLVILNAMDDSWDKELRVAVDNWEAGVPVDPLSLSIQNVAYDFDCTAVEGKLKVCNGNYGATRWRGINEVILNRRTNTIISSAAKMNEYYLPNGGRAEQRLYTLCHEIGHGFGLPHWDEDFYNEDLGNCMDYTSKPQNNMLPDASNFLYLGELYGNGTITSSSVATTTVSEDSSSVAQQDEAQPEQPPPADTDNNNNGGGGKNGGKNNGKNNQRQRNRMLRSSSSSSSRARGQQQTNTNNAIPKEEEEEEAISSAIMVHPQDDGQSRLLVANDRIQVHYRELEESPHLIRVYQYLLE